MALKRHLEGPRAPGNVTAYRAVAHGGRTIFTLATFLRSIWLVAMKGVHCRPATTIDL